MYSNVLLNWLALRLFESPQKYKTPLNLSAQPVHAALTLLELQRNGKYLHYIRYHIHDAYQTIFLPFSSIAGCFFVFVCSVQNGQPSPMHTPPLSPLDEIQIWMRILCFINDADDDFFFGFEWCRALLCRDRYFWYSQSFQWGKKSFWTNKKEKGEKIEKRKVSNTSARQ